MELGSGLQPWVVMEVWDNDGVFMAQIVYEDGDQEDMRIEELEHLLQQGEAPPGFDNNGAKPSYELQWPIFEVTEADLVAFWEYHIASLQEKGSRETEAGADNSLSVKPDKITAGVDYEVLAWIFVEQKLNIRREPPW